MRKIDWATITKKVPKEIQDFFDNNPDLCFSIRCIKEQTKYQKQGQTSIQGFAIGDKWMFEMRLKRIK